MTQTYQPQPPPQQPQPKKKRGALKWILIVVGIIVALFVVLVIVGAALGEDEDTATPAGSSSTPSEKPSANASEVPTVKVGEKVTDDGYQFTVSKISCGVRRVGDQYMGEKAAGQFCLVSLRVKNVSKDPITFSSENQALLDTKGRSYSPDHEAWLYVDEDVDVTGEINPGNVLRTTVPFDVPEKTEPDYLLLKAGVFGFSEGVRVKL